MQRPVLTAAFKRRYLMIAKIAQHIPTRGIEIANAIGKNVLHSDIKTDAEHHEANVTV